MKHRTQILLEDWQYASIKETARKTGTSLSSLLRKWITEKIGLGDLKRRKNLMHFAGALKDTPDVAKNHDHYLGMN